MSLHMSQLCQFYHNHLYEARHLHVASHELGDLLGEAEPFQKLLTHPFMAGGAQHLGVEEGR